MICGHTEWCGPDPSVVRLTDNGVRKVQVTLRDERGPHRLTIAAVLADPQALIDDLTAALAWASNAEQPAK